jgi:hypothetical protein
MIRSMSPDFDNKRLSIAYNVEQICEEAELEILPFESCSVINKCFVAEN